MRVAAEMLTEQRFAGHVPGRGADGAAHTRPALCSHVRVPALIRDFERVGDGGGQADGERAGAVSTWVRWTCSEHRCGC